MPDTHKGPQQGNAAPTTGEVKDKANQVAGQAKEAVGQAKEAAKPVIDQVKQGPTSSPSRRKSIYGTAS